MDIGIAEDDLDQLELMKLWLSDARHACTGFDTAAALRAGAARQSFDLLVIDWMLPDGTGGELLHWLRQERGLGVPVIVVTARDDEATVCQALAAGADDYVVKPAKRLELLARIEAVSRRVRPAALPLIKAGAFVIDIPGQRLTRAGREITLTQKEFDLATYLFQNHSKLLSRDHLLDRIWGISAEVDTRTVDTHISRLRKKLTLDGSTGWKLVPIYGYGYRFDRVEAGG
jgi:DNA-binding response OmpR family regulator